MKEKDLRRWFGISTIMTVINLIGFMILNYNIYSNLSGYTFGRSFQIFLGLILSFGFFIGIVLLVIFFSCIVQINEYERGIKFSQGQFHSIMSPGWRLVIPIFQSYKKIDIRTKAVSVPEQDTITKDNISVRVNAVIYYKIFDAGKALLEVENFYYAVSQLAQTTMRNIVGSVTLDELLVYKELKYINFNDNDVEGTFRFVDRELSPITSYPKKTLKYEDGELKTYYKCTYINWKFMTEDGKIGPSKYSKYPMFPLGTNEKGIDNTYFVTQASYITLLIVSSVLLTISIIIIITRSIIFFIKGCKDSKKIS